MDRATCAQVESIFHWICLRPMDDSCFVVAFAIIKLIAGRNGMRNITLKYLSSTTRTDFDLAIDVRILATKWEWNSRIQWKGNSITVLGDEISKNAFLLLFVLKWCEMQIRIGTCNYFVCKLKCDKSSDLSLSGWIESSHLFSSPPLSSFYLQRDSPLNVNQGLSKTAEVHLFSYEHSA